MTVTQERDRLKAALQDRAEYSPYTGDRLFAREALDYSKPLKLSTPIKSTGTTEG